MDTFIDKLAQKKNAQEMIRANSAAEAAKMEQMQKQMREYDELMQEIRRVNIRTAENVENMRGLLAQCMEKLACGKAEEKPGMNAEEQAAAVRNLMEEQAAAVRNFMEEQADAVRNLMEEQMTVVRGLQEEQAAAVRGLQEEQMTTVKGLLEERLTLTEDIVHKENVKVYRKVQAAYTEEMEKQNQQDAQNRTDRGGRVPAGLSVAILIGVIVDIAINLLPLILKL